MVFNLVGLYVLLGAGFLLWSTNTSYYENFLIRWRKENKLTKKQEFFSFLIAYVIIVIIWLPGFVWALYNRDTL